MVGSKTIHEETLLNGDTFIVCDKPRVEHKSGNVTGLCLDLRHYYDKSNGSVKRKRRTDQEVLVLSRKWLTEMVGE